MNEIYIKKIKLIEKQNKIKIDYSLNGDDMSGTFSEPANPELYQSFEALTQSVCDIMEFNLYDLFHRIVPYGVTYSHGETMRASIQFRLHMDDSDTETAINTPTRKVDYVLEDGLDVSTCKLLENIERAAIDYLNGKRVQTTLFDEQGQPTETVKAIEG